LVQCGGRVLTWVWSYFLAQRIVGGFSLFPRNFHFTEFRALFRLGTMNLIINIAQILINRTDSVVIGVFLGVKWVAYYNIGRMLVEYASQINFNITRAFTPHLTHLYSKGDIEGFDRLFLLGVRFSTLIALPLAACMFAFGRPFLGLWVGEAYVSRAFLERSDVIMTLLLLAQVIRWPQSISWQLIVATGKYRFLVYVNVAEAILNLGLSLLFVRYWGMAGVALGTLIPMALSNLIFMPVHVLRRFHIPLGRYFAQGIGRSLATGALQFVFCYTVVTLFYPSSWRALLAEGALAIAFAAALAAAAGLTRDDRRLVLDRAGSFLAASRRALPARFSR